MVKVVTYSFTFCCVDIAVIINNIAIKYINFAFSEILFSSLVHSVTFG